MTELVSPPPSPSVPQTKFRIPRLRRDTVPRPALLARVLDPLAEARVVLVQAPAGFGKTTLLVQLAAALSAFDGTGIVWISLDADDNDPNRLFSGLFAALEPLDLPWEVPPATLLAQLRNAGPAARAALGPLLNALGARPRSRIALVLDDLHHLRDAATLQLLDALIDRLPPEVCLFIGSRVAPALSLARWRAAGELVELSFEDLQFDAEAVQSLCRLRGLDGLAEDGLQAALARTHGWAVGLQLMLGSGRERGSLPALIGPSAHRHMFDYFAQEVLAELPEALQDFMLQCAVLPELSPALCGAVTGCTDAAAVLEGLYRRQLFLSVLDEAGPVLRLHDLFRDFLAGELQRRHPGSHAELHARAAAAETHTERAVQHWLAAGRWEEALAGIRRVADALLAAGGATRLERWLDLLPAAWAEERADLALLRGHCAWSQWDWLRAGTHFERAHRLLQADGAVEAGFVALGMLGACRNATGDLVTSRAAVETAERAGLPPHLQVPFDSLRAWLSLAEGEHAALVRALHAMADHVQLAPQTRYPNVVDMGYGHFVGLPGVRPALQRLVALCQLDTGQPAAQVPALEAWLAFWHDGPDAATERLQALLQQQRHLPGALLLTMSSHHLRSVHLAVQGRAEDALAAVAQLHATLDAPDTAGQRIGWRRSYLHVQARLHWLLEDAAGLQALLPELMLPRTPHEWPLLDMAAAQARGQLALLQGDTRSAREWLDTAVHLHEARRLPAFVGDPRLSLAMCCLAEGDAAAAARRLDEVLAQVADDDGIGLLLLEPPARLLALWEGVAPRLALPAATQARMRQRLAAWRPAAGPARRGPAPDDDPLSEREREVLALLADGLSNKLIARTLDLSPHTVKRHVANILTKLTVDSRTQAAACWHRR